MRFPWLRGYRSEVVRKNLEWAFPELSSSERSRIAEDFYRGLARTLSEVAITSLSTAATFTGRIRLEDDGGAQRDRRAGRRVLVLSAHRGNWEWLARGAHLLLPSTGVLFQPPSAATAARWAAWYRSRSGTQLFTVGQWRRQSRSLPTLALLADQAPLPGERRVHHPFFDRPTWWSLTPLRIRSHYDVVYYADVVRDDVGVQRVRLEALPEPAYPDAFVRRLERGIRERPGDWLWSHRRWKGQLTYRRWKEDPRKREGPGWWL